MLNSTEKVIKHKVGLLNLAQELGNVSQACRVMGLSRDTFYRYKTAVDEGGVQALLDQNRRQPNLKNRTDERTEAAVVEHALAYPAHGHTRASNELRQQGYSISPSGVRSIWLRHELACFNHRLKALEARVAQDGIVLSEAQVAALEKKKQEDIEHGEIETEHPGYLGSQDTFYVGMLKGVGRIYQQTFVDTYSKVAICKLYTTKTALTAADLLNDRVLPFFEQQQLPLLRLLTDRGTEYCGHLARHEYELYLALNDIDHSKTKARSPQTNGICERFHKTLLQEFYQVAFRKTLYTDLETLQSDLDQWLMYYNEQRTHQGKMCCGRTPMATLEAGQRIWQHKFIA